MAPLLGLAWLAMGCANAQSFGGLADDVRGLWVSDQPHRLHDPEAGREESGCHNPSAGRDAVGADGVPSRAMSA